MRESRPFWLQWLSNPVSTLTKECFELTPKICWCGVQRLGSKRRNLWSRRNHRTEEASLITHPAQCHPSSFDRDSSQSLMLAEGYTLAFRYPLVLRKLRDRQETKRPVEMRCCWLSTPILDLSSFESLSHFTLAFFCKYKMGAVTWTRRSAYLSKIRLHTWHCSIK